MRHRATLKQLVQHVTKCDDVMIFRAVGQTTATLVSAILVSMIFQIVPLNFIGNALGLVNVALWLFNHCRCGQVTRWQ